MEFEKSIKTRMKKINGQVNGIVKMIEEERDCAEVLIQISAVTSALNAAGKVILENHLKSCFVKQVYDGKVEEGIKELDLVLDKFIKMR